MSLSQVHYLPLAPPFFFILVGLFVALLVLIQLGVLRYAYMRLGISSGAALLLLLASLMGSYFNIPVAYLPEQQVLAQQEIDFFGVRYVVPSDARRIKPPWVRAVRDECADLGIAFFMKQTDFRQPRRTKPRPRVYYDFGTTRFA